MRRSSTAPARRRCASRRQADRRRHRCRQQRRAAARGVLPLCPPPHERLRRRLDSAGRAPTSSAIRLRSSRWREHARGERGGQQPDGVPKAIGEVRYLDRARVEAECADFRAALDATPSGVRRAVHDRALARHRRRRDAQRALRHRGRLSRRARRGAAGRIRGDRQRTASCCSSTAPTSRWSGTSPTRTGRSAISSASSSAWSRRSTRALVNMPRERVRLHVCWGNYEARTTATWRSRTSCRSCARRRSAASCCRSPTRAMPHEYRCCRNSRSPTIRSSSPA